MVTPTMPKKRTMLTEECQTKKMSTECNVLFFDNLADIVTENIVRGMVPKSRQKDDWTNDVPVETVLALLNSGISLRRVAQKMFRSIHFATEPDSLPHDSGVQVRGSFHEICPIIHAMLSGLADGVKTLQISAPLTPAFADVIAKHCSGLRHLYFQPVTAFRFPNFGLAALMVACGPSLQFVCLANCIGNACKVPAELVNNRGCLFQRQRKFRSLDGITTPSVGSQASMFSTRLAFLEKTRVIVSNRGYPHPCHCCCLDASR